MIPWIFLPSYKYLPTPPSSGRYLCALSLGAASVSAGMLMSSCPATWVPPTWCPAGLPLAAQVLYPVLLSLPVIPTASAILIVFYTADLYSLAIPRLRELEFVLDVLVESLHRGEQEVLHIFGPDSEPGEMEVYLEASQFR